MIYLSISIVPRFSVFEFLFLLKFKGNFCKLLFMNTNFEFFRNMFVLESVRLIILTPFWHLHLLVQEKTLLQKLKVIFGISVR